MGCDRETAGDGSVRQPSAGASLHLRHRFGGANHSQANGAIEANGLDIDHALAPTDLVSEQNNVPRHFALRNMGKPQRSWPRSVLHPPRSGAGLLRFVAPLDASRWRKAR